MFGVERRCAGVPQDQIAYLYQVLAQELANEFNEFTLDGSATNGDLHFFRVKRLDVAKNAVFTRIFVARVRYVGSLGSRELFYTFYSLKNAPLETARGPRTLLNRLSLNANATQEHAWLAECEAYNASADSLTTIDVGDVIFVPSGMELSEGREFFLTSRGDGAYKAIPELGRQRASTCLATRDRLVDYFHAVKVTAASLQPVVDARVRASMQQHGDFLIRPRTGNPSLYEIAGRMPTQVELDAALGARQELSSASRTRRHAKVLFL